VQVVDEKRYNRIMTNLSRTQVVSALRNFKHGMRTNLQKRTLTNHDAIAFVLWNLGTMKFSEIQDVIAEWRFGFSKRTRTNIRAWDKKSKGVFRNYSPIGLGYMFNTCHSGGYSFVADRIDQRGHWMHSSSGYVYRMHGAPTNAGAMKARTHSAGRQDDPGECDFFRRTYWYRVAKGHYAPSLECAKRMAEIGHAFKA
jgi:hypothetical protein